MPLAATFVVFLDGQQTSVLTLGTGGLHAHRVKAGDVFNNRRVDR